MLAWIMANKEIVGIAAMLIYAMLPANSPIKAFLNKLIGGIVTPTPTPTPSPGPTPIPTPTPVPGIDLSTILQLLMNLLLKAKAAGDTKTQEALMATIEAVQVEAASHQKSAMPPSILIR